MYFTTVQCLTANMEAASLCGIELTIVRNSRIYIKKNWLFRPPNLYLSKSRLEHPAITLSDLVDAPYLYEVWDEICPYFDHQFIIFHQLPENIKALTKALNHYGLNIPNFTFGSTMMLAKRLYPHLTSSKLPSLCDHLGFHYTEEKLGDCTFYMAQALLKMGNQLNESDEEALFTKGGICLGSFESDGISYPDFLSDYQSPFNDDSPATGNAISWTHSLRNEVICFTGPLESMTRSMAVKKLTQKGAHYQSQISSHTTLVVTNLYDETTGQYRKLTSKLEKALRLKGEGQKIKIINEDYFLQRLNSTHES